VEGRVAYENGKPVAGGAIQFIPLKDLALTISGKIDGDGNFSLQTIKEGTAKPGAPEGEYRVTIVPSVPSRRQRIQPYTLAKTERVGARVNQFAFAIPPPEKTGRSE
jgi:hypothetical protein